MSQEICSELTFYVNGKKIVEVSPDPEWTLLYYLRRRLGLTGTKLGCAEGGCGACTVMVSKYDHAERTIQHMSANACLAPLCAMHGLAVTTVEGIGSTRTKLHPVQERLAKSHGTQCGFCTPGIVMSMYTLLRNNNQPSTTEIQSTFEGNLCRCTGYRPILEGFFSFANKEAKPRHCPLGEQCCQVNGSANEIELKKSITTNTDFAPYEESQEPIFPPELQLSKELDEASLYFKSDRVEWYRPSSLADLLDLKAKYPQAKLVVGNTEIGVEVKFKNMHYPVILAPTHVQELNNIVIDENDGISIGASVTLSKMKQSFKMMKVKISNFKCGLIEAVLEMLRWFAGHQVRNVSAIAGNIMTASPISDLNPLWLAAECTLTVASKERGMRQVLLDQTFFTGYRKTVLQSDEVVININIPFTKENEYFRGYKQAHRRDDDIAIVNAGMKVSFEPGSDVIKSLRLAYGGMAPTTVMALKTMNGLIGKNWTEETLDQALKLLAEDLPLPDGVPAGSEVYRKTLTTSFFFKFYLYVLQQLKQRNVVQKHLPETYKSAIPNFTAEPSRGVQVFEEVVGNNEDDAVGRPVIHKAGAQQVTGEARYCDDIPPYHNELYFGFVLSTKAHANIVTVDPSDALNLPGVVDYISHRDVPGSNVTGPIAQDEELFATDKVTCQGQVIGGILAIDRDTAQRAAKLVRVEYEELPPIITIRQAIEAESFFGKPTTLVNGDTEQGFEESDHVLEGEIHIGGQEHFYLETQACIVVPKCEDGEVEVYSSTQAPTLTQMLIAKALGVSANRVVCRTKRMGGGFGGKETKSSVFAAIIAVAARKLGRPVRCMLDRDEDMVMTGTRHPYLGKYKVGYMASGEIKSAEFVLYSNAGNSLDLSECVMNRAVFHVDNCYRIPNIKVAAYCCKTNISSNTAFRGFGAPQGMLVCETMVTHIADELKVTSDKIREMNMYKENDITHFNQKLVNCNILRCWNEVKFSSKYEERQAQVKTLNQENRWKKRGISLVPVKFGIAFEAPFLNQAGALIHVYKDGSILLTHAGTEMGQGLHTKMIQVTSRVLEVSMSKVFISETSTNTIPNTSATAASVGSDLNGMAVMKACHTIKDRLKPYMSKESKGSWEDWVTMAYLDGVSLSATGFYKFEGLGYDWGSNQGNPFLYFTFGAACSEVEVDCLTGDHVVLRTDIVIDLGRSLNPAIDIGQIEGAFVQGYGLFVLEEQRYSTKGLLYTRGPGAYKLPGFSDIPREFNVSLLKGASNPKAVYSSKAVGEPPLFLASSVFFAIKSAIQAARSDSGADPNFQFDSPATSERIRMACVDKFTQQFPAPVPGTYTPWAVLL